MASTGRACVIGGQGTLGGAVVEQLRSGGWTVQRAGRRPDDRDDFRHVDLDRPDTLGPALGDVDLTISTVPDPGLAAERWVLEQGGLLVNCSHAPGAAAAELAGQAKHAKGTVLLNAGLVPGIANLAAAELLEKYPDADCLEVAFTVLREGTAGRGGEEFVYAGLASRSHHRMVSLPLPEPFGMQSCIEVHEDSDCGFGGVAGARKVENYLGFADRSAGWGVQIANILRLMQLLPKAAFTAGDSAGRREVTREPTAVWLGAKRGEERLGASVIECEGDYRVTAAAAAMFGETLVGSERSGCFNPEDLFSSTDLADPLEEVGVRIAPAQH